MTGILVFALFATVCGFALLRPSIGAIGFYSFLMLDPGWNWRWNLPVGFPFQKYIFFFLMLGFLLSGLQMARQSSTAIKGIAALSCFLGICYLSALQSIDPGPTTFFLSVIWKVCLVAIVTILVLQDANQVKWLLVSMAFCQGYNALQINLDYLQTGISKYAYQPWGSFGADNNGYSIITMPMLAISMSLAFSEDKLWKKAMFGGIAILQIHQVMLMASRGCMIAAIVVALINVILMKRTRENLGAVMLALVLTIALAGPSVLKEFGSSFGMEGKLDTSAESRFFLWQAGWRITLDYPLLGVGPNAARRLVPLPQYYEGGLTTNNKALHNLFFDISAGMGIFGFFAFFTFMTAPLLHCFKTRNVDDQLRGARLAVLSGIPGYLVASMFSSGALFESGYLIPVIGYCCSNLILAETTVEDESLDESHLETPRASIVPAFSAKLATQSLHSGKT